MKPSIKTFFWVFPISLNPIFSQPHPFSTPMSNMYVSSSTTGGRTQVRTLGIPSKCWYRNFITESSSPNPIKTHTGNIIGVSMRLKGRYIRLALGILVSMRLKERFNHVFKWVYEAFTDEIQQLEYQVRMLEEEIQVLKAKKKE